MPLVSFWTVLTCLLLLFSLNIVIELFIKGKDNVHNKQKVARNLRHSPNLDVYELNSLFGSSLVLKYISY